MNIQPVRIIVASLLAAVVIFMWGFVFWAKIPSPYFAHQTLPTDQIKNVTVDFKNMEKGTYLFPQPEEGESDKEFAQRTKGEMAFYLNFDPDGAELKSRTMLQGFLHAFVASVIAGVMICIVGSGFCCYAHRVFFVICLGIFATVWVDVGDSVWWFRSCGASTWHAIYHIVAWTLGGLVIGAIVDGKPVPKETNSKGK